MAHEDLLTSWNDTATRSAMALQRAADEDWIVVSIKDDWATVHHDLS